MIKKPLILLKNDKKNLPKLYAFVGDRWGGVGNGELESARKRAADETALVVPIASVSESEACCAGVVAPLPKPPRKNGDEWALCERTGRDKTGDSNTVGERASPGVD